MPPTSSADEGFLVRFTPHKWWNWQRDKDPVWATLTLTTGPLRGISFPAFYMNNEEIQLPAGLTMSKVRNLRFLEAAIRPHYEKYVIAKRLEGKL